MAFSATSGAAKNNMVMGLAALVCHGSGIDASADNMNSVISASGNEVPAFWAPLYAQYIEKAGGADKFFTKLGGGGGGAAAPAGNELFPIFIYYCSSQRADFYLFRFLSFNLTHLFSILL